MKKSYLINDLFWLALGLGVCLEGLHLGFGSFQAPESGFMPTLAGLVMALLSLADIGVGFYQKWEKVRSDEEIWAGINWPKLIITLSVLCVYVLVFSTLGFLIATFLLLLFLFQVMERKPWKMVFFASSLTTILCYLAFKTGLDCQLPQGLLGF